jgi:hypothetical protein
MKIIVCGSMSSAKKMVEIKQQLTDMGHDVVLPKLTEEIVRGEHTAFSGKESTAEKIEHDLLRDYYEIIKTGDAVLVVNLDKNGVEGYIGGNSFLEMGFAHVLGKTVYVYQGIPDMPYTDELRAMQSIELKGDLSRITH